MAIKKSDAAHDCKKDCELLHKEIAALKKEVAALKAELKKAPKGSGGADPRVDLLVSWLKNNYSNQTRQESNKKVKEILEKL